MGVAEFIAVSEHGGRERQALSAPSRANGLHGKLRTVRNALSPFSLPRPLAFLSRHGTDDLSFRRRSSRRGSFGSRISGGARHWLRLPYHGRWRSRRDRLSCRLGGMRRAGGHCWARAGGQSRPFT